MKVDASIQGLTDRRKGLVDGASQTGLMKPEQGDSGSVTAYSLPKVSYSFEEGDYWKRIPAWKRVSRAEFSSLSWQLRNSVTSLTGLSGVLQGRVSEQAIQEFQAGLERAPMNVRLTPYLIALIDWEAPETDPVRRQFLPMGSQMTEDHPCYQEDSLNEDGDKAAPFLTHRYADKALFLPTTICPVYCSYCTRSRVVGGSTPSRDKATYGAKKNEWEETFEYIRSHHELEDIVISGGDASMLRAEQVRFIGTTLLEIPHIRRIRFATKGIAILPMQFTDDDEWVGALAAVSDLGRRLFKEVCVHTHFGSEHEMTGWTLEAMRRLVNLGIKVRNQSVLLRGVNDSFDSMFRLIKKLSFLNIQPYYVYAHDMVPGCEHLRTSIGAAEQLAREIQGSTAGFNLPRFVCDAPGGGGKREISSYDYYDPTFGISIWSAPKVKPGSRFCYYDPIERLSEEGQQFWDRVRSNPGLLAEHQAEIRATLLESQNP